MPTRDWLEKKGENEILLMHLNFILFYFNCLLCPITNLFFYFFFR